MAFGTLTLADLQATLNATTIARIGEDVTFLALTETLDAHNRIMQEVYSDFATATTDESRRYGGGDTMVMEDSDELTVPRGQKVTAGSTVGFPLNSATAALQWSEMWFRKHTLAEFVAQVDAMMDADRNRVIRDIKRGLYYSSNYTHTDHLARNVDLAVKRLVNADSAPLPTGPNGEVFTASTHTHYLARAGGSVAASDLDAAINTVKEHYTTGEIQVLINQADDATVRAFTGFVAYPDARIMLPDTAYRTPGRTLDPINFYNRAIGLYNGAEVVVKPWVIASYPIVWNKDAPKPLCYRYDPDYGEGLQLIFDNPGYPLRARGYRRIFGIGAWNRINGAVLYTGNTSYANPTIN